MRPTTEPALRISRLFSRRPTTAWAEKEIRVYRKLVKDGCFVSLNDLGLIERYYAFQRKKEDGIRRRDLYTFLNNYAGELDRARAWAENQEEKKKRVPTRYIETNGERPCTDEEFEAIGKLARAELERFKSQFRA